MTDSDPRLPALAVTCPVCNGRGWNKVTPYPYDPQLGCKCQRCNGKGYVKNQTTEQVEP